MVVNAGSQSGCDRRTTVLDRGVRGRRQREGVFDPVSKMKAPAQRKRPCNVVEFKRTRSNNEGDLR